MSMTRSPMRLKYKIVIAAYIWTAVCALVWIVLWSLQNCGLSGAR